MSRLSTGRVIERSTKRGRVFALRFTANGERQYVTLGAADDGWNRQRAEEELANTLADVRRGLWRPARAVAAPAVAVEDPGFHAFASEWLESRRPEVRPRTVEALAWALTGHLLPHFHRHRLADITITAVDAYRVAKVMESADLQARRERGEQCPRPLSNRSINTTIAVLAQVMDAAIEHGWVTTANPARGKRRRLKAEKPRRTWLELDELRALLDAAGEHRALLAVMALGGLRVGEATALCWGAVDLANGRLHVLDAKTAAGRRTVDLSPDLRDMLAERKAAARTPAADDLVFHTREGRQRNRQNVRANVLAGAVKRANAKLVADGKPPIVGLTNHSLRRTFASLLYESGSSPAYVMGQMGHTSSALALEVYSRMMTRDRGTGARMDALVRGAEVAPTGTSGVEEALSGEGVERVRNPQAR